MCIYRTAKPLPNLTVGCPLEKWRHENADIEVPPKGGWSRGGEPLGELSRLFPEEVHVDRWAPHPS